MSEYWVSKKQYFCQYCKIFIRDDAPSRRQHETGLRHQGNKDRYLRDIYKTGEKAVKEKAEEKKIMAQIEKQAALAHGSSGHYGSASASSSTATSKPKLAAGKPAQTDKYANYSSAADLGFVDADSLLSDRAKKERDERAKIGQAGAWETVAVVTPSDLTSNAEIDVGEPDARYAFNGGEDSKHRVGLLRGSLEDDPGEEARNFRFETDGQPGDNAGDRPRRVKPDRYDDGEWDPDSILTLSTKKKNASPPMKDEETDMKPKEEEVLNSERTKGEAVRWQKSGINESKSATGKTRDVGSVEVDVKQEDLGPESQQAEEIKKEEIAPESKPSAGSMFKKRKAPGAANRSVRQKM